ncbi:MAG: FAD-dependent oxidoreductase [Candidatus Micrarchaeota archaeon]|nr:FAD-dependent oxidoreductase [Candidatus Micrarchaeota archaeon]MDE1834817.1 FAD-dependent oxidoreductase [Candidatus Micrarchaeota archaeon]MDE1859117.1 FAD-dependent oxidoreductase [Candidatus Micrarchaeota archaeon]
MDHQYDIIVAGSGIAGSLAAAGAAKGGAKVLLLDRNDYKQAGKKTNWGWVCGDAVANTHVDFVAKEIGLRLTEPVLDVAVDGVQVLSPDLTRKFQFEGAGYSLDRPKLAKTLVDFAVKNGADYKPHHEVEGPIIENNAVVGVYGRDEKNEQFRASAKIVIDALGVASTIRRKLPKNNYIENMVSTDDIESTGRYIYKFEADTSDLNYYDPKNALIHLNQQLAPGGYGWVFPKSKGRINIGIGVEKKSLEIRNERLNKKDTLHSLIDQYVQWNPHVKNPVIDDQDANGKGYWSVTVRRQFDSLVYPGYMGAGDSMAMPNPISAGGIGPAMSSGAIVGKIAAQAVAANDASLEFLWRYNLRFNEIYGNKTAGLEVFRIYLQSLNNDLINYGMAKFLTEEEAVDISYGRIPEITIASTFQKVLSGISNINAFKNLLFAVKRMKEMNALYERYPETPAQFDAWKREVNSKMHEVKEKFKPNPI